jgi:hypothetical protein
MQWKARKSHSGSLTAARRLPGEGDVVGITPEPRDVSADPFQRERLVVKSKVSLLDNLIGGILVRSARSPGTVPRDPIGWIGWKSGAK